MTTKEQILQARTARMGPKALSALSKASVGVAGLGGLGSHIGMALARMGVGRLVLVDVDRVDLANLHRQHYALSHVGQWKADAITEQLRAVDPYLTYEPHRVRVTPENLASLFGSCQILCEAFDSPEQKATLVESALTLLPETIVVSGCGMAGMGPANLIQTRKAMNRLYLCGDGQSDLEREGSFTASRVQICAAHQANAVLRLLLGETP